MFLLGRLYAVAGIIPSYRWCCADVTGKRKSVEGNYALMDSVSPLWKGRYLFEAKFSQELRRPS